MRSPAFLLVLAGFAAIGSPQTADAQYGRYGGGGYGRNGSGYYGGYYPAGYYGPRGFPYSGPYLGASYRSGAYYVPSYYAGPFYGPGYSYGMAPMVAPSYSAAPLYAPASRTTTMYPPADSNGQVRPAAGTAARPTTPVEVIIQDNGFQPASLVVQPGSIVRWTNQGTQHHTVSDRDGRWDSGEIAPGATYSARVQHLGTYAYLCRHHAEMQAAIIVRNAAASSAAAPAPAPND